MNAQEEAEFYALLEKDFGEAKARALLKTNEWGNRARFVVRWLEQKDLERSLQDAELQMRSVTAEESAAKSASQSAEHADRAANAAQDSADTARRALIIALIALFAAIGSAVLQAIGLRSSK